jgi:hypothetical protein
MAKQVRSFTYSCLVPHLKYITAQLSEYLSTIGHPCPTYTNPADRAISLVNTDFEDSEKSSTSASASEGTSTSRVDRLAADWKRLEPRFGILPSESSTSSAKIEEVLPVVSTRDSFRKTVILTERNFLNYIRNILAFGIRSKYHQFFISHD